MPVPPFMASAGAAFHGIRRSRPSWHPAAPSFMASGGAVHFALAALRHSAAQAHSSCISSGGAGPLCPCGTGPNICNILKYF
jgi:hypothetical protein